MFCSFTFSLGAIFAGGVVLIIQPELIHRLADVSPLVSVLIGSGMLAFVALYVLAPGCSSSPASSAS